MVVKMMEGALFESELALQGYLTFYHLLLAFVLKYPELRAEIDRRVDDFAASERNPDNSISLLTFYFLLLSRWSLKTRVP
jgi:hypothetical protein